MGCRLRIFFALLLSAGTSGLSAQSWSEVRADDTRFLWAEGWGESVEEADREALSALAGKISLTVVTSFRSVEGQISTVRGSDGYSSVESRFATFSSAFLSGAGFEVLERGRRCHVVRWIGRDEVEMMRKSRMAQVKAYISEAEKSEHAGRISAAIKYYCWAYALVRAFPELAKLTSNGGMLLSEWLPSRINVLLSGLKAHIVSISSDRAVLEFTYNGMNAFGTEFRYFDGTRWSDVVISYDGRCTVLLRYNASPECLHLKYEYLFLEDANPGGELACALEFISGEPLRKTHSALHVTN